MRYTKRCTNTTFTHRPEPSSDVRAQEARTGVPHGFVHADGDFVRAHRSDIVALLTNESGRAAEDNPLAQILELRDDPRMSDVLVATTTEHLAIRLGRALQKAFDGQVRYGFSHENQLARVWWHRDAA